MTPQNTRKRSTQRVIQPMLAESISEPFDSGLYLFEPKWDGFRCLAHIAGDQTVLRSRNGHDFSAQFPELADLHLQVAGTDAILDGELVIFTGGKPDFHTLLRRSKGARLPKTISTWARNAPVTYLVFDLLELDGRSLLSEPLTARKDHLVEVFQPSQHTVLSNHVLGSGIALYAAAKAEGLEGIMAKKLDSPYVPGKRTRNWLKCKVFKTLEACIVGFTARGNTIASLAVAVHKESDLVYIGHVGTGFSAEEAIVMRRFFQQFTVPFSDLTIANVDAETVRTTHWLAPRTVCEVKFLELTPDQRLRHPSFVKIRPDKTPQECTWTQINADGGSSGE